MAGRSRPRDHAPGRNARSGVQTWCRPHGERLFRWPIPVAASARGSMTAANRDLHRSWRQCRLVKSWFQKLTECIHVAALDQFNELDHVTFVGKPLAMLAMFFQPTMNVELELRIHDRRMCDQAERHWGSDLQVFDPRGHIHRTANLDQFSATHDVNMSATHAPSPVNRNLTPPARPMSHAEVRMPVRFRGAATKMTGPRISHWASRSPHAAGFRGASMGRCLYTVISTGVQV